MDSLYKGASVDLETFLHRPGSNLPRTAKLTDGFCGNDVNDTLEADEILVFYKVERQKMIIALDEFNQELCVPRNSKTKLQVLPTYHNERSTLEELISTGRQTMYFRVLEDIPSLEISSETTLIMLGNRPIHGNLIKCHVVDLYDSREVLLPLQLAGRFQPLLDAREYFLEEVLAQYQLPVNVRFVSQPEANDDACARPLSSLGNIRLVEETEVEMVYAISFDDQLFLNVFPRTLDISVSCGFKVTSETSKKIKACRQSLVVGEKSLKRLDTIISNSFYLTACPVRRFNFESLQAKQSETSEKSSINKMARKRDHERSWSTSRYFQDEPDYENIDVDDEVSKLMAKFSDEVSNPLSATMWFKARSLPTTRKEVHVVQAERPHSPCRPVPKPRNRSGSARTGLQEDINEPVYPTPPSQTQKQRRTPPNWSGKSDPAANEAPPKIPPRPRSKKPNNEANVASREENLPPVPPREPCPVVNVTEWWSAEEEALNAMDDDDPYIEVTDDDYIEVMNDVYSEAKDDGRVFRQDDFRNLDLSLICLSDEEKAYVDIKSYSQEGNEEKRDREGYLQPVDVPSQRLMKAEREDEGEPGGHFDQEVNEEDATYDEIKERAELPQTEHRGKENAVNQKTTKEKPTTNFGIKHPKQSASRQIRQNGIIISPPHEDDFLDFKDIEIHYKLKKQLSEAQAKLADLQKKVTLKEQTHATESPTQQPPISTGSASVKSENAKNSQHMNKQKVEERSGSPLVNRETNDDETTSLTLLESGNIDPLKAKNDLEDCVTSLQERRRMRKSQPVDSDDDDDDYAECYEETGFGCVIEKLCRENELVHSTDTEKQAEEQTNSIRFDSTPIYYNTVDKKTKADRTSPYLHLENQGDEDVYFNIEVQESERENFLEKVLGIKKGKSQLAVFSKNTAEKEHFTIRKSASATNLSVAGDFDFALRKRASSTRDKE